MQIKSKHLNPEVNFRHNFLTFFTLYVFTLVQCFENIKLKKIYIFNKIINNFFLNNFYNLFVYIFKLKIINLHTTENKILFFFNFYEYKKK